jgi:hypothetical protein
MRVMTVGEGDGGGEGDAGRKEAERRPEAWKDDTEGK